ncbi:MAG: hypothetical protein CVU11_12625 [Bacteroidetes bacterium HGW-Bacteroidetes-6]|jgi:VanZ family protein|nr:MAG: hypothetical protein CVU11_12625 [Bacteroidetes bacterium HGW-Bacteroidetes-6]
MAEKRKLKEVESRRNRLLLLSIIVILVLTLVPGNGNVSVPYLDKVVHFFLFLALSVNVGYKYLNAKRLTDAMILAIFFGLITEVGQQFIPGRDMDLYDGIADTIGIIVGYYFYRKFRFKLDKLIVMLGA